MKYPILMYVMFFIQGVVTLLGGFFYKSLPRSLKMLLWLLIFTFVASTISFVLASLNIHNLWISHINTLGEFIILMFIFKYWIKYRNIRLALLVCLLMFIALWIVSKFTFEPFTQIDGWTAATSKILQIIFSVLLFVEVVKESDIVWTNDPRFWIAAGVIIYSAGSLFMFALFNEMLVVSPKRLVQVFSLNWILIIISNLFYARGFLCKK